MTAPLARCANPDEARHAWPDMATEAARQLWLRRDRYPALVAAEKMDAGEAAADIAAWEQIAADWDWIATGKGQPAKAETLPARITALDTALDRIIGQIEFRDSKESRARAAIIAAMRWWAEQEDAGEPLRHARFLASIGHQWRAENGHPPLSDMIHARTAPEDNAPAEHGGPAPSQSPQAKPSAPQPHGAPGQRQLFG